MISTLNHMWCKTTTVVPLDTSQSVTSQQVLLIICEIKNACCNINERGVGEEHHFYYLKSFNVVLGLKCKALLLLLMPDNEL